MLCRWFELHDSDGSAFGKVLVSLSFTPFTPSASPPRVAVTTRNTDAAQTPSQRFSDFEPSIMHENIAPSIAEVDLQTDKPSESQSRIDDKEDYQQIASATLEQVNFERVESSPAEEIKTIDNSTTLSSESIFTAEERTSVVSSIESKLKELDLHRSTDSEPTTAPVFSSLQTRYENLSIGGIEKVSGSAKSEVSSEALSRPCTDEVLKSAEKLTPKKKLTKSLFKLATPEKNHFSPPQTDNSTFFTPLSPETDKKSSTIESNQNSIISHEKVEVAIQENELSHSSPSLMQVAAASENPITVTVTNNTATLNPKSTSSFADSVSVPLLSSIFTDNTFESIGVWAKKTTAMLQGAVSTALKGQSERKKGKEFIGFGVGKLYVNIISAEKVFDALSF